MKKVLSHAAVYLFVVSSTGPIIYCLDQVLKGNAREPFRLGNVRLPWLEGAGATYFSVLVMYGVAMLCVSVGLYAWYKRYLEERDFCAKYGIEQPKDFAVYMLDTILRNDERRDI